VAGEELDVWLYGIRVARIDEDRRRPRLTYTEEALAEYAAGTPLLSLSLPVRRERYPQGVVRGFLDGLLLEGDARRRAAREVGVAADDTFAMIRALGRDCAGAVVIQPAGESSPPPATTLRAARLDGDELIELVANLESAPLGVSGRVRVSLAGVQDKLVLTRLPDGAWGRPVDGTPSTHILKPEVAAYPDTVANEAFCMRLVEALGLEAATVETTEIGGRRVLVVERYDRIVDPDGAVHRVHQEDFCQATDTPPSKKYQEDGGPSLRRIGSVVAQAADVGSLERLLRAVTLNAVVGNGDAHAKNFSLLHERDGRLRLAPVYDLMSTLVYGDQRLAMTIDSVQRTDRVTVERIGEEASTWGISRNRAREVIEEILTALPGAVEDAWHQTPDMPARFVATVHEQIERLGGT
jgi:serine/threonine-protein kinase HipA